MTLRTRLALLFVVIALLCGPLQAQQIDTTTLNKLLDQLSATLQELRATVNPPPVPTPTPPPYAARVRTP